jgi:GTPase
VSSTSQGVKDRVLVVANKAEGGAVSGDMQAALCEASELGLGEAMPLSAEHNEGISELTSALVEVRGSA